MKFATIQVEKPKSTSEALNGRLTIVSKDGKRLGIAPQSQYPTLQSALDEWAVAEPLLRDCANRLEAGRWNNTLAVEDAVFMAPLPRAYAFLDGSAFIQHIILVRKARKAEPPEELRTVPLMYQGLSDSFLGPNEDIPLIDEAHGLDFEAEVGVVLDRVPMGTKAAEALPYVKLLVLLNDVSLRNLIPRELKTSFGFFHGKPSSSFAPYAVTPDELGEAWAEGRLHLDMLSTLNGKSFGYPDAGHMHFSFYDLIEHAAKTRNLAAGTVLGSGTVSNEDESVGSSCLAEKRMLELINSGSIETGFMKVGDTVEIDMQQDGKSVFGRISQKVVQYQR